MPLFFGRGEIVSLSDDESDNDTAGDVHDILMRSRRLAAHNPRDYVDLTTDIAASQEAEIKGEDEDLAILAEQIDLGTEYGTAGRGLTPSPNLRLGHHLQQPSTSLVTLEHHHLPGGLKLKKGKVIEAKPDYMICVSGPRDHWVKVNFLKIHEIKKDLTTGCVHVRCSVYTRASNLHDFVPKKLNEVVKIVQYNESKRASLSEQAYLDVSLDQILPIKRTLHTTNAPFPEHRFTHKYSKEEWDEYGQKRVFEDEVLVCRWWMIYHYRNDDTMREMKPCEWVVMNVPENDADDEFKIADKAKMNRWRGGKKPGGAYCPSDSCEVLVALDSDEDARPSARLQPGQTYKVGDFFSGCGGVSRGMTQAGMKVEVAVDHWTPACDSFEQNFPKAKLYRVDMHDYLTSDHGHENERLDIVHLSPPCQVYSPAHTVEGKNDEANVASLFACDGIIRKHRPRLFTLEQTFGIILPKSETYFRALVHSFTALGFSVRWRVLPFLDYGLAQPRRRLVMFGAGPGEPLPSFPAKTHSLTPHIDRNCKPLVTVASALAGLESGMDLHHPETAKRRDGKWRDPNLPLRNTVTCDGGGKHNIHWSGKREFTLREFATLQGFPIEHRFAEPSIKKQIGNAFPASVVRVLYEHLAKSLDQVDGFDPIICQRQRTRQYAERQGAIELTGGGRRVKRRRRNDSDGEDLDGGVNVRRVQRMAVGNAENPITFDYSDSEAKPGSSFNRHPRGPTWSGSSATVGSSPASKSSSITICDDDDDDDNDDVEKGNSIYDDWTF